jgi:hypothetical protein
MSKHSAGVVFEARNPGKLPVPGCLGCFMVGVFGMPAVMLPLMTWKEVPQNPWLLLVYIGALFPLAVLYVLKRLMSRYNLRVFQDGLVEIVYPFKTVRITQAELASVALQSTYVAALNGPRTSLVFTSRDGRMLASLAPQAFGGDAITRFVETLRSVNPDVSLPNLGSNS